MRELTAAAHSSQTAPARLGGRRLAEQSGAGLVVRRPVRASASAAGVRRDALNPPRGGLDLSRWRERVGRESRWRERAGRDRSPPASESG